MVSYSKLWKKLIDLKMTKTELRIKCSISTVSLAKLSKNENVSMDTLIKICNFLNCDLNDIVSIEKDGE